MHVPTNTLAGAVIGLILFLVFERKRIPVWAEKIRAQLFRRRRHRDAGRLATALAGAGFFADLSEEERGAPEQRSSSTATPGVFEHPWRVLDSDDEELAEGEVGTYFDRRRSSGSGSPR